MTPAKIEYRLVKRFFAPYVSVKSGSVRYKSFATRRAASEFIAKEFLLDAILGERECEGDPGTPYHWWGRPGDFDLVKYVFDCQFTAENGLVDHYDDSRCIDSGKAFCAAAWKQAIREIGNQIMNGNQPELPAWAADRKDTYKATVVK